MKQKRVLAVHDISCVGRCSLTVALPILSAAGLETSVLPTAVLSTHTGGFTGMTMRDLTDDLPDIYRHWETLDLQFDAIYTGYLGSSRQVALMVELIERFGRRATVVVDPVMGDDGALYPAMPREMPQLMRQLCEKADIIVPNRTEAALMLGRAYEPEPVDKEEIDRTMERLKHMTDASVVLTGVGLEEGRLGAAVYDAGTGATTYPTARRMPGSYHGTGDVYASALTGAVLRGHSLSDAARIAAKFTQRSIELTVPQGIERRYGVCFELALAAYIQALGA